jgi:4-alpha-glucanotransferase
MSKDPLSIRRAGALCHITSLPGPAPTGTLGRNALEFLEFMQQAGLTIWQMLPLNPPDHFGSPYHSASLFALHSALIDPALGLTSAATLRQYASTHSDAFERFQYEQAYWLGDYGRFIIASTQHGSEWTSWPEPLRIRDDDALKQFDREHRIELESICFAQFAIDRGFANLRSDAASRGVLLFGDMPLYPAFASADVWAHQDLFLLDGNQRPRYVAGVPPDYFSATGQLWGNPVYDWERLRHTGFAWWIERMKSQLRLFDVVRIDHFRGLEAFWAVPPDAESAIAGAWQRAPGHALLEAFREHFDPLPVVAEDLGVITKDVEALRDDFALPGMRVAQFAFSGDPHNPHLPTNYVPNTVAYTGTHDNDTTLGWYRSLDDSTRADVDRLTRTREEMPWALIDTVLGSIANLAVVPMQDFFGLDGRHRMNTPGQTAGNWHWGFERDQLTPHLADRIRSHLAASGRV